MILRYRMRGEFRIKGVGGSIHKYRGITIKIHSRKDLYDDEVQVEDLREVSTDY